MSNYKTNNPWGKKLSPWKGSNLCIISVWEISWAKVSQEQH